MSQTMQLLNGLKKCLKAKGITYRQLAVELNLSEASIKRLFSEQTFSLKRLEDICKLLDLNFYDLAKISMNAETGPNVLTMEQEQALAESPKLLLMFYLMLSGREPESIVRDYRVSESESVQLLVELDRLKLIELHPGNKVRLLTQKNIEWRKTGPVAREYEAMIKQEFLASSFDRADERLGFEAGKLSEGSRVLMLKKINRLVREYYELTEIDKGLPGEKIQNTGLMIAFRPWVFSIIDEYRRQ